eukprot:7391273-Prymnesium_polylepis.1
MLVAHAAFGPCPDKHAPASSNQRVDRCRRRLLVESDVARRHSDYTAAPLECHRDAGAHERAHVRTAERALVRDGATVRRPVRPSDPLAGERPTVIPTVDTQREGRSFSQRAQENSKHARIGRTVSLCLRLCFVRGVRSSRVVQRMLAEDDADAVGAGGRAD